MILVKHKFIKTNFRSPSFGRVFFVQGSCKFYQNVLYLSCDGVITDGNGLIYMRARYYSPDMRRFINADVVAGDISNAITLNRFAYANGNPVSSVDPFGLSVEERTGTLAHELSHQLGADDHYCYRYDSFSDANDEESEHCTNQNCCWCNGTALLPDCLMTRSGDYPNLTSLYCSACRNTISTYVENHILP